MAIKKFRRIHGYRTLDQFQGHEKYFFKIGAFVELEIYRESVNLTFSMLFFPLLCLLKAVEVYIPFFIFLTNLNYLGWNSQFFLIVITLMSRAFPYLFSMELFSKRVSEWTIAVFLILTQEMLDFTMHQVN